MSSLSHTQSPGIAPIGMGFGLSASQSLIHALGGHMDVDTEIGREKTCIVTVPKNRLKTNQDDFRSDWSLVEGVAQ